ncbi:hypothetical protein G7Y79_00009g027480 [Physcia stellaris]|nr:hypothetical protein G7Y79_00009g027480 [Physcia stellaris]
MCEFSREPQKRGPSKGYIKELAERVGALESDRVQIAQSPSAHFPALSPVTQSHGLPISYSGTPPRYGSNKRTHSMSEDLQNSPALQAQLQASVNLPTKPGPGPSVQRPITTEGDRVSYPVEEMETALNVYYTKTHPFLPFLPHSKDRLLSALAKVSSPVHEAFNAALILYAFPARFGTLPSSRSESLKDPSSSLTQAVKDLLHDHHATQTQTEKLVALQAVLLMIFADEVHHPREIGNRGWYGQAFVASTFMFQNLRSVRKHGVGLMDDLDAHHLLLRRAFLSLVAMERWNAAGTSAQTIIPEDLTYLVAADKVLLGDLGYSALNASFVLGHVTDIVQDPTNSPDNKLWRATCAEKDRVVQFLELEKAANNAFLPSFVDLYFHQQVPSRLTDLCPPTRTLNKAISMLSLLAKSGTSFPLNHHLTALALMILDEAIRKREIGIEARQTLEGVHDGLARGVISAGETWTRTLLSFVEESLSRLPDGGTTDRAGLQNLADAAVGETEDGVTGSHNLAPEDQVIVRTGYLTYVIQ